MKSLAELEAIREATISRINVRTEEKGETTRLTLTGGDGSEPEWRSQDSAVASVSSHGEVVAVGPGDVTALWLLFSLLGISLIGITVILKKRKK